MRNLFFIFILFLVGFKIYAVPPVGARVAYRPITHGAGVVVIESPLKLLPFPFFEAFYHPILKTDLKELSNKRILKFINMTKAHRSKKLPMAVYKKLLDIALFADIEVTVRAEAILALGELASTKHKLRESHFYLPLVEALRSASTPPLVRKTVAQYLGQIKPHDPVVYESLVLALLHDTNAFVRKASAVALGAINPRDAIVIRKLSYAVLLDKHGGVQQSALSAIRDIADIRCSKGFE